MPGIQDPIPQGGVAVIVPTTVFLFFAIVTTVLRFYSRYISARPFSIGDWLLVGGLFWTVATIGIGYALVLNGGVGLQVTEVTPAQLTMALKLFIPASVTWAIACCLIKLSVLFFFINIFTMRRVKWAVWIVIILTSTIFIGVFLQSFLLCRPLAFNWDKTIDGTCGDQQSAYLSIAIIELINDFVIVVLPMPVLWQLQMPTKKKIAISFLMGLGLIVCAFTAARIQAVLDLDPMNFTYTVVNDLIFAALELELGIIVANLPLMRPLMRQMFGSSSAFASVWKRSNHSQTDPKRSMSARDRYYGNVSGHSRNFTGRKKSLNDSFDDNRAPPAAHLAGPTQHMAVDRFPFDERMSTASTARDNSSMDLEDQPGHQEYQGSIHVRDDIYVTRTANEDYNPDYNPYQQGRPFAI